MALPWTMLPPLVVSAPEAQKYFAKLEELKRSKGQAADLPELPEAGPLPLNTEPPLPEERQAENTSNGAAAIANQEPQPKPPQPVAPTPQPELDPSKRYYKVNCEARNDKGLMPDVVWKRLVEKSGKQHVVLAAETDLTQVSVENFGGEGCWPKLWSLNPAIENPHRVPLGTKVVFIK
jgi:hypothetical protein